MLLQIGFLGGGASSRHREEVAYISGGRQESGCKGMCMNICKLPAEQFFDKHLGLPLTVTPNFETQVPPPSKISRILKPSPLQLTPKRVPPFVDTQSLVIDR